MGKAASIIVLCEDMAHEVFVKRFLSKGWGVPARKIRIRAYPTGKGSGKDHILKTIGEEAKALRSRPRSTMLIVVLDADEKPVQHWHAVLDQKSRRQETGNLIVYVVPRWHLETWLAYLDAGGRAHEGDKKTYKKSYDTIARSKKVHPLVDKLALECREGRDLPDALSSLQLTCKEFAAIRSFL